MMNQQQRPKIIHYCWFGPKALSPLSEHCIASWKKYFPEYELMFWNEQNSSIEKSLFASQALEYKQYAFVSDYVRVQALYGFGGIYLDTDVEALHGLKECLERYNNIVGFGGSHTLGTGLMAFMPQHPLIKRFLEEYDHPFIINGNMDISANPGILEKLLLKDGLLMNNTIQQIGDIMVFSRDYFSPKKNGDNQFKMTENTVALHYFDGSWLTDRQKKRGKNKIWINVCRPVLRAIAAMIQFVLGKERTKAIELAVRKRLK